MRLLNPLKTRTLSDWLAWIETLHPRTIELGLERVHAVLDRMGLCHPDFRVLTIAGTNGKGSTVAMCEAILRRAGYRVGAYTSPHLITYNERIRVDGRLATDAELRAAFERIEAARGETPLTYFEFGTLAAFELFRNARIDIAVLEVGMGGRLDAVNGIDADVAVITSVDIDHTAWLGTTREAIGYEKAGIFRHGRPAICSDPNPPAVIASEAARVGANLLQLNRDFFAERGEGGWTWRTPERVRSALPYPAMRGDYQLFNAAAAVMALDCLADRFPVSQTHLRDGLASAMIPGRFQVIPGQPVCVLDVAHNPQAARALAATLKQHVGGGKTLAVCGMLKDKDMAAVFGELAEVMDRWYVATLDVPRGASAAQLQEALTAAGINRPVQRFDTVLAAYDMARREADASDRIVVFGSFHTVGDILATFSKT